MLVSNQKIKKTWTRQKAKYYKQLGYEFTEYGDEFYVTAEHLSSNASEMVDVKCDYCDCIYKKEYYLYVLAHKDIEKDACDNCKKYKKRELIFNKNASKYFNLLREICKEKDYILLSDENDYIGLRDTMVSYICPHHGIISQGLDNMLHGHLCRKCGRIITSEKNKLSQDEVNERILEKGVLWKNYGEYIDLYEENLQIKCKCGDIFTTSFSKLRQTDGFCPNCVSKNRSDNNRHHPEDVIKIIEAKNNNKILNPFDYIDNKTDNLKILCGQCKNNVFVTSLGRYLSGKNRCDKCSQRISVPELRTINLLKKYDIKYLYEHRFNDCKDKITLSFDFYLPDFNTIIETDGQHHYRNIWGEEHLEKTRYHDKIKNEYCKNNNINLIRIPFWNFDNLENILIEKLNLPQIVDIELSNGRIFKYRTHKQKIINK